MKTIISFTLSLGLLALGVTSIKAQGCSDAGVCTAGTNISLPQLKKKTTQSTNQVQPVYRHGVKLGLFVGKGDNNTLYFTPTATVELGFTERLKGTLTLPYTILRGNHYYDNGQGRISRKVSTQGLSDPILALSYKVLDKSKWTGFVQVGARLAAGKSNNTDQDEALEMPLQTSLGSNELILGTTWAYKNSWLFSTGFQLPLNVTQNQYRGYADNLLVPFENRTGNSYLFKRQPDGILRVDKRFQFGSLAWQVGALGIWHFGEDTVENLEVLGRPRVNLKGSSGLTLNLTTSLNYALKDDLAISLQAGVPVIVREVRPDGLTRSFVIAPGIEWRF